MIGAWTVAGARFVATRDVQGEALPVRLADHARPDARARTSRSTGSSPASFGEWIQWGTNQVNWLHENDRMFPERDHIHTLMYKFRDEQHADPDGVPAELALDHRVPRRRGRHRRARGGEDARRRVGWFRDRPCPAEVMTAFTPVPLFGTRRATCPATRPTDRFLQLYFLDERPARGVRRAVRRPRRRPRRQRPRPHPLRLAVPRHRPRHRPLRRRAPLAAFERTSAHRVRMWYAS